MKGVCFFSKIKLNKTCLNKKETEEVRKSKLEEILFFTVTNK